jgi:hypothetical protein
MTDGAKAARTGMNFKAQIRTTLTSNGFTEITVQAMQERLASMTENTIVYDGKFFAMNVHIGTDIYTCPWKADFVAVNGTTVRILHVRWQQVGGSVDQKFPFFVENARRLNYKSIFILGGDGFKQGARKWLQNQKNARIIEVFTEEEFQEWANNGNL